ncbi:MAG: prepilin-type N-terminal cleavage/methylation domain-containing protein [Gemmatimonadetes bacterium]|nr:prepilin-type N-terminal cleavage/methylation domain-containing protein [Gemmatimonadota bacterium]
MSQQMTRRRCARDGFTAIEMLIVVVVIGVMAATVMPRISRIVAEERVRKLQGAVATDLELAFALASRQRKPVTVTYNIGTKTLNITNVANGTVLKSRYLGQSQTFSTTAVTFTPSAGITVFPAGLATAACTVTVSNGSFTRRIAVTRAGLVTKS